MNVCFVQVSQWGGSVEFALQELAKRLPKRGINIHILTNPERKTQLGRYYKILGLSDVHIHEVPFRNTILRNWRILSKLLRINRVTRIDVIQIFGAGALLPLLLFKRIDGGTIDLLRVDSSSLVWRIYIVFADEIL
ncbi:MAG: glycosyltransferase [Thermoproteota archaeon]